MRNRSARYGLLLLCVVLVAAAGCADQGEGQRCDQKNNSNDCASPLLCTPILNTVVGPAGSAICCPPPNQPITSDACRASTGNLFTSDAGAVDSGRSTAPADAGRDAAADGSR